jgi:adenylate cyclase
MTGLDALARQAGVDRGQVEAMIDVGVLAPGPDGAFTVGDVRRAHLVRDLVRGGVSLGLIGEGVRRGTLRFDFVDDPSYDRFSAYEPDTFEDVARRTGVPVELLTVVREAAGSPAPTPTDHMRATELEVVPFLEAAVRQGVRPELLEQTLRVAGDGARRLAETEADWWRSEILAPLIRDRVPMDEIGRRTGEFALEVGPATDAALVALFHGQQAHAWMRNIFDGFETALARAGLYERVERPPAISFIDVTGYSHLTEEHGDASAADLAGRVARLVARITTDHGGRTVKWLGDGLMVYHPDATSAVSAGLELRDAIAREHLPPIHVGIHAGPVLFQEGDYFGRTVNAAARIAAHASADQILVSDTVVTAIDSTAPFAFASIGPVELKGVLEPLVLSTVSRADRSSTP